MVETEAGQVVIATTQNGSRSNVLPSPHRFDIAVKKLSLLRAEFVSEAERRAADDVGAAMSHQLNEPLTALLLYLHAIKQTSERPDGAEIVPASVSANVEMALREAERICEIVDRVGHGVETPVDTEAALARGREAIDSWTRNSHLNGAPAASTAPSVVGQHSLTPRERQVLALITGGASNKEGAHRLGISTRTVEAHRAHLMAKLGTRNAAELVRVALATFNDAQSHLTGVEDLNPTQELSSDRGY
jgi:DNA-binding CsgD family transcriptional regulator